MEIGDFETSNYSFIAKTGSFVINPQFDSASLVSEGLAAVRIGDYEMGTWGFIAR